jgi:tRNA-binding protein
MSILNDNTQPALPIISLDHFLKIDIRIGTITRAEVSAKAKRPAYILMIDFGPSLGIKKSSAQITINYTTAELVGKQVAAVVNFAPLQIGELMSEVLTLGFLDNKNQVILFSPDKPVPNGSRMH